MSLAAVAIVLVSAAWFARGHAESLKQFIDDHPIKGVVVYIGLNVLDAVIAPAEVVVQSTRGVLLDDEDGLATRPVHPTPRGSGVRRKLRFSR